MSTIEITPPDMKFNLWGKIKTAIWNFILPPHIRFTKPESEEK